MTSPVVDTESDTKLVRKYVEKVAIFLLSFFVYMQSQQMDKLEGRMFAMQADKVTSADLQVLRTDFRKDMDVMSANLNSKIDTASTNFNNKMDMVITLLNKK